MSQIDFSEEAILVLRALNESGGRLIGRLDRNAPFSLTDPTNADLDWRQIVDSSVAWELHNAGFIEIDESAPIRDIYVFQISPEGKGWLTNDRRSL